MELKSWEPWKNSAVVTIYYAKQKESKPYGCMYAVPHCIAFCTMLWPIMLFKLFANEKSYNLHIFFLHFIYLNKWKYAFIRFLQDAISFCIFYLQTTSSLIFSVIFIFIFLGKKINIYFCWQCRCRVAKNKVGWESIGLCEYIFLQTNSVQVSDFYSICDISTSYYYTNYCINMSSTLDLWAFVLNVYIIDIHMYCVYQRMQFA